MMESIIRNVESLEKWEILKAYLIDNHYTIWQMQYGPNQPEGSHTWFWKEGKPYLVEVITHSQEIHDDLVKDKSL